MSSSKSLNLESSLPISKVSELTGYKVSTFYTESFLRNHPTLPRKKPGKQWNMTVRELIEAKLLTEDLQPTRSTAKFVNDVIIENEELPTAPPEPHRASDRDAEIEALYARLDAAQREADYAAKDIEVLNRLLEEKENYIQTLTNVVNSLTGKTPSN